MKIGLLIFLEMEVSSDGAFIAISPVPLNIAKLAE